LCRIDVDWEERRMTWTPLTAHLTSWRSQDAHPHPRADPSGRYVYFNSDRDGRRAVYRVALAPG
jgi:Tol biopolymer transport system component